MTIPKRSGGVLLFVLAVAAVLAPVRLSPLEAMAAQTVECATCCSQTGSLCIICGKTCLALQDAYDNGGGACT